MTKRVVLLVGLVSLTLFSTGAGISQTRDDLKALREEIEHLKESQKILYDEFRELKSLLGLEEPQPAETAEFLLRVDDQPFKGSPSAALTIIEFSDYQCPFCARHFRETMPQIERDYIKTGKVRYVFRDFPIESIHPRAFKAAEAAHCAGEQGKYWQMHDRLFADQKALAEKDLPNHAEAIGLEPQAFRQCLASGKYATGIRKDLADGSALGVKATPTFLLGFTEASGAQVKVLRGIKGAAPYAVFKKALDGLLATSEK